jgi:hypothetical protein
MTVARRGSPGTPIPTEPEAVEANTEFTLRDGDSALFPPPSPARSAMTVMKRRLPGWSMSPSSPTRRARQPRS